VQTYAEAMDPFIRPDNSEGLSRIQLPANASPTDTLLPFYRDLLQGLDVSLQTDLVLKDSLPIIMFKILFNNSPKIFPVKGVPVFYQAGFLMDFITKAYFSIDSPGKVNTKTTTLGLHDIVRDPNSSTRRQVFIESIIAPMFSNTIAFSIKTTGITDYQLTSEYIHPTQGPLAEEQNFINDYLGLNIFQNIRAKRTSPVQSNQIISNMAYAEELNAIAWTTFGPFGAKGVNIASLNNNQTSIIPPDPAFFDAHFLEQRPLLAWNPYELRWYASGLANNMYDYETLEYPTDIYRPAGISVDDWSRIEWDPKDSPFTNNNSRLMIVYADASLGLYDISGDRVSNEAIKFQQVYKVVSASGPRSKETYVIRPLSREFTTIDAIGFSPSAVVFGGSAGSGDSQSARICFKLQVSIGSNDMKAAWSVTDLNVPGTVTAIKYVGYAWYIATWNPIAERSSLFFASLTFAGITSIDSWNSNSTQRVTVIDAVLPPINKCTDGFEPDPSNPAICIKKCPENYEPFGTLCVQRCPQPFSSNGIANECIPDSIAPKVTVPSARGQQLFSPAPKSGPCEGPNCANPDSINYPVLITITTLVLIALAFIFGIIFAMRPKN
jgi:hypothetical protein